MKTDVDTREQARQRATGAAAPRPAQAPPARASAARSPAPAGTAARRAAAGSAPAAPGRGGHRDPARRDSQARAR